MIDTSSLRCKVLELAMRGDLLTSMRGDGSLVDNYKDIAIEENTIPYAIPATWIWVRVKDVIKKDVGGGTPSKSIVEYWEKGNIPWASVKDFSSAEGGYLIDTIDHITQEGLENSSANMVDEKAIIICMRMALGKIVRAAKPIAINQDLRAVWLNELADEDYFVYFYSTIKVEGRGMTVAGIRKEELMNYPFPLPPIEEQKRIVHRVNEIFELLEKIDKMQESYFSDVEILKTKLIDAGIQGKLTEQLFEDGAVEEVHGEECISESDMLMKIPVNWKWIRLGWAMEIERGGSPRPIKTFMTDSQDGINWIKIGDVAKDGKYILHTKEKIKPEGEKKSRRVYPGDFLLTNSMSFGRPYISRIEGCIHDGWLLLRNSKGLFDLDYLYWLLSSQYVYNQFCKKASGATVDNLNKEKVASAVVPLPPICEQKRIASRIEQIMQLISQESLTD